MSDTSSTAVLQSVQDTHVVPVVLTILLIATAFALAMRQTYLGIAGVVLLSLLSLAYGATQSSEDV